MRSFSWLRARRKTVVSSSVVTVAALAVTTMAFVYDGNPTTEVDLNDGGVWVTKQSSFLVGHFNHESELLDGGFRTVSEQYDILQAGDRVVLVDPEESTATTVDPALVILSDSAEIPANSSVALGAETISILDGDKGRLWVVPAAGLGAFSPAEQEPLAELGAGAVATVGRDGTVYAASAADRELVTVEVDAQGEASEPKRSSLGSIPEKAELQVTVVGDTAVVLDTASGTLVSSGGLDTTIEGAEGARVQQPSDGSDAVIVATPAALVSVPFDGSEPVSTPADGEGTPAEPVSLGGCAYGVWSGSATFVRDCIGDADDLSQQVPGADSASQMRFRVNRDVIVLNDIIGGSAWMAAEDLRQVDNWNDITPPEGDSEENDEETTEETVETTLPERTDENTVPVATDDKLGVRPGRTTVLPVIDNDSDPDGDVLVASVVGDDPSLGAIQPINNGGALQIAVPEGAIGSESFEYEIDDGRGGTDTARVTLTVRGWDDNAAPKQKRVTPVTVETGGTVSYNVLPDWIDPDGDDVFLQGVIAEQGDEADFTSDGRITYRAISGAVGRKDVVIIVSDGESFTEGVLRLEVRPVGSTVPITNADHVVARVGETVTVAPLTNDTASGSESLRLARVEDVERTTIVPDYPNETFSFVSDIEDVYYVQYQVSAGPNAVTGIVRIDVVPAEESDLPPIAVRDVALLPSGGEVLVNVLSNDTDPGGGILVVQSVTVDPASGVSAAVLNHETLRITDHAALDEQVRITYRISNGTQTADGEVVVIPVPAPSQLRAPVANDDTAIVRAGDVVTIPVLANDYHPNNDTIHVAPDLVEPLIEPEQGEMFVSQDTIRFRASDEPGTVYATYDAVDTTGQFDAGFVTIQVLPLDPETNTAPRPRDLTARVLSGSTVDISVPLDGIDADGDSVELIGLASAPSKGRITETGPDHLTYEAFGDSVGVDAFTYRVRDRLGKEATGSIRVGIAGAEALNQAPYAGKDSVVMRPGREVAVPVLENDSDPDGDQIVLLSDSLVLPDVEGLTAEVEGNRVVVTSPDQPVETSLQYSIRDERGARATAVLQVSVDEDVPLKRPIARDDSVSAVDIEGETVDVEVLANDEDPDGTLAALTVTVPGGEADVRGDGTVRVTMADENQLIMYTITDIDDQSTSAFIRVPGLAHLPPTLTSTEPVEVVSGEPTEIPLADHVRAAGGGKVVITEVAKVSAAHSDGGSLVKDQTTLTYTSAAEYFGQDAVTFEVTDGTGPDDPDGRKATLTIPITVKPPANQPPTFVNGQMTVAPGEEATGIDLLALTSDPDPEDLESMNYTLVGQAPAGLTAAVDGDTLMVSADSGTKKGTSATLKVRVTDGVTDPIEGNVVVTVTASTRPLPTANDDIIAEAHQGDTISVPVLENDFNPFPGDDLKILSAEIESGDGAVAVAGTQVDVTPDSAFFGTMVVRYRIQDVTEDADREVEGRIRLTVQGRPDAPGKPTVSSAQDRTVVLSWSTPADNGAEITGYTVSSPVGGFSQQCPSTTCTLTGLTNNTEYTFTVVATNRVADSDPSLPSEVARPDARPDTPQPPTLAFGDRSLGVTWVTPPTPGSPVKTFTLEISPAPPSGITQKAGVTGNFLTWEGLENGVDYQVRVRAHNLAIEPSSWSEYSQSMIPAAPPAAPAAPTTARNSPVGAQAQLQVSWAAPEANGDAIDQYEVSVLRGGSVVNTVAVPGGTLTQAITVDTDTTDYTFSVRAHNKAGWGEPSGQSAPRRAFVAPGAPTITAASPGNNQIAVTYTAAAGNGANAGEIRYEYSVNGGAWQGNWGGTSNTITNGVPNNGTYKIRVRAYTSLDGVRYDGDPSAESAGVQPFGPVNTPGASATNLGQSVRFNWTVPAANGRPITKMQISHNGGGWQDVAVSNGSTTVGNGYDQTHSVRVRAQDSANQWSNIASDSARTDSPPPPPPVTATTGRGADSGNCNPDVCYYLTVTVSDNFPSGRYQVNCLENGKRFAGGATWQITAGRTTQLGCWHGGYNHAYQLQAQIVGWGTASATTWQ